MAGRKSDFTLTKLDDLFTTQAQRDEEQLSKIRDIPLELIDDFSDHPFKVMDDEDMMQLVESVKERGVITPATVRQKEDGRYELVSGHRRKRACELAGFETPRSEIVDLNRDEATILMVESNFQRSEILPSEKAFAPIPLSTFAGEPIQNVGKSFIKNYCAVLLEGAVIVLACIIFSVFASSPPVVNPDAAAVTQVWAYIGELVFNMLVLVGAVKMSDRIIREMMGL